MAPVVLCSLGCSFMCYDMLCIMLSDMWCPLMTWYDMSLPELTLAERYVLHEMYVYVMYILFPGLYMFCK